MSLFRRAALALALIAALSACKRHRSPSRAADDGTAHLASTILTGDPAAAVQLVTGFHGIEEGAWRWTERRFSVSLGRPLHATQRGANLVLKFTIPPVSIERLHSLTLSAYIQGTSLPSETYDKPGDYTYVRPIAAALLAADPVRVEFQLDKAIPPTGPDLRELGLVVHSIGLEGR